MCVCMYVRMCIYIYICLFVVSSLVFLAHCCCCCFGVAGVAVVIMIVFAIIILVVDDLYGALAICGLQAANILCRPVLTCCLNEQILPQNTNTMRNIWKYVVSSVFYKVLFSTFAS